MAFSSTSIYGSANLSSASIYGNTNINYWEELKEITVTSWCY